MYQQHTSLDSLIGEYTKVISLMNFAMKNKHMENLNVVNTCNPMEFVVTKWQNISKAVVESSMMFHLSFGMG
jgi:hypothetical protein